MSKIWGRVPALAAVAMLAGCTTAIAGNPAPLSSAPPAAAARSTAPPAPAPNSPDKITAACPFLSPQEFEKVQGLSNSAGYQSFEEQPDQSGHNEFTCSYGVYGQRQNRLVIFTLPDSSTTPASAMASVGKSHPDRQLIPGVGDAGAVYYELDGGIGLITSAKRSHGVTRSMIFDGNRGMSQDVFVAIAKLVTNRL
jgi:hypothetical protein